MDARQLARLEQLFYEGLGLAVEERPGFCERHCADDPELFEKLRDMLLDESVAGTVNRSSTRWDTTPRSRIGRYRIVRTIGRGGMGSVYEAIEPEPLSRRVALKILRVDLESEAAVDRFHTECRLLARLDHPGIPRILDAGTIETGRPWFSMSLVDGVRLDDFLRTKRPSYEQRVDIFLQLCEAIQHAHEQSTLHLDLKPSNVLVSSSAAAGPRIHVIDFGIGGDASLQEARLPIGSLDYMSPEQARGTPSSVDNRTDVYGLGALLHEILAGSPAFDRAEDGASAETDIRTIVESSTRADLRDLLGDSNGVPRAHVDAYETIVRRATDRAPADRFGSAAELADAVRQVAETPGRRLLAAVATTLAAAVLIVSAFSIGVAFRDLNEAGPVDAAAPSRTASEAGLLGRFARLALGEFGIGKSSDRIDAARGVARDLDGLSFSSPRSEGHARYAIGQVLRRLGRPVEAVAQLRTALIAFRSDDSTNVDEYYLAVRSLSALQETVNAVDIDDFSALSPMLHRVGVVDDSTARALSALVNTTAFDTADKAMAAVENRAGGADWSRETTLLVADTLEYAARHHRSEGVFDPARLLRLELDLRQRVLPPNDASIVLALTRLADAVLLEDGSTSIDAVATQIEDLVRNSALARDDWRAANAASVRGAALLQRGPLEEGNAAMAAEYSRLCEALPVGAEPRRALLVRWLAALPADVSSSTDTPRRAYATELAHASRQPRAWRLREPAIVPPPNDEWSASMRGFAALRLRREAVDASTVTAAVERLVELCTTHVPEDREGQLAVAAQLASWCRLDDVLSAESRMRLARASVDLARRAAQPGTTILRYALMELARAALYAEDSESGIAAAREAIALGPPAQPSVDSMYPHSLLVESMLAAGRDASREAEGLLRSATENLDASHPFRRYVENLAVERAGARNR